MALDSINPASGQRIASHQEHSSSEISSLIGQARLAFLGWRETPFAERAAALVRAGQVLTRHRDRYARLMTAEMGKPLVQAGAEVDKCAACCAHFAEAGAGYLARETLCAGAQDSYVLFQPLGVVLAVMPWNFPFWQVFRAAVPALVAGNAVVLKHASNVTGCALACEEVFREADFPAGLFRTLRVGSARVGELIAHPHVQAVTLTGSTAAGAAVAAQAGARVKKSVLELGGSDPYLVLEDADLATTVESCVTARLINSGQSCIAAKRFIVVGQVGDEFEARFVSRMREQKLGDPLEPGTQVGPLARWDLRDELQRQVRDSVARGARLLCGGEIPPGPGAYYPPTVLTGVTRGMPVFEEETFGPVAAIVRVRDEQEALEMANQSPFGLGAAVFTRDLPRGQRLAARLDAGCVFVNDFVRSDPRLPFGGVKLSGYGRELSSFGIREFVNIKTVWVRS
jgi:succinate-semialdehyde dehydrogenase / glutarate-semialdehyde dehydrogenase